jgi:predicted AAA+ superfamily ATPase
MGHPVAGPSYEGFVIENLLAAAGPRYSGSFFRTADGSEVDLLLERGGTPDMAIEVKRSSAPSPNRGFAIACDDLGVTQRYVVYPGRERFSLRHGATAIGLAELMAKLRA